MLERAQAESQAPEPSGDWRADPRAYARDARAALPRHPWAIGFIGHGPPSGPNDARNAERLIAVLGDLGRRIRQSGRYPHPLRVIDADLDPDSPQARDERFEFGLDCVLDGIAARIGA
jgi:hypothetical protein